MKSFKFHMMLILWRILPFYCIARLKLAIWLVNSRSIQNHIGPRKCILDHKCKSYKILQFGKIFVSLNFHVLNWIKVTDNFPKVYWVWKQAKNFPKIYWKMLFYFFIRLSWEWPLFYIPLIFINFSEIIPITFRRF